MLEKKRLFDMMIHKVSKGDINVEPLISVIVPTYKRESFFLVRSIDSILGQTYENFEIIIVDDNANPENKDYKKEVKLLIKKYNTNKIVYLENKENIGGSLSRNVGIRAAKGEYITFLDDDDKYLPEKLRRQVKMMMKNNWDMSFTDLKICNTSNKVIDFREYSKIKNFSKKSLIKYHITRHITGTPTFMFKKEIIKDLKGFPDVRMGQEFFLMLNTIEAEVKIGYIPSADVIAYRHNNGGISSGQNKIDGEKKLFKYKQNYYSVLSKKDRTFVKFRHQMVLGIAYKRNNNNFKAYLNIFKAFITSPYDFMLEGKEFVGKLVLGNFRSAVKCRKQES